MRSTAIMLALAVCSGCAALSPADEAMEQISYCVTEDRLDSLSTIMPSLRLATADGSEVINRAAECSPEVLGAALAVAKPPREAAAIFINMMAGSDTAIRASASVIARQAIRCYQALGMPDECDTFVTTVDQSMQQLPTELQAMILTGCTTPTRLGQFLRRHGDQTIIEAVRSAYGTDTLQLNQFNNALK